MRTLIHIALILFLGVGSGLVIRALRRNVSKIGPAADEMIYSNDNPATSPEQIAKIENPDPSHPPEDEEWLSRFELTERSGRTVSSESLLGQPYIVSFFFSTCPSICVQQNHKLKELQDEFKGQGVRFIAISVDPETDTPERLREYAARFGADKEQWLFMTGDLLYIRRIGAEIYQQAVDKQNHTERFALVDPTGQIEGFYSWSQQRQFEKLKSVIQSMLDGTYESSKES